MSEAVAAWASVLIVGGTVTLTYASAVWRERREAGKGGATFEAAGAAAEAGATAAGERTSLLGRVGRAYSVAAVKAAPHV